MSYRKERLSSNPEALLDCSENSIAARACLFDIASFEREAETFGRGVRLMNGHMTPPHASVVPEVVIRVFIVNSKSDFGLGFHLYDWFRLRNNVRM